MTATTFTTPSKTYGRRRGHHAAPLGLEAWVRTAAVRRTATLAAQEGRSPADTLTMPILKLDDESPRSRARRGSLGRELKTILSGGTRKAGTHRR